MRIRANFEFCFHANIAPPRVAFVMRPVDAIGAKGYDDVARSREGVRRGVRGATTRVWHPLCRQISIDDDDDEDADASDEARRGSMKTARRAREEATMLARLGDEHANVATLVEFGCIETPAALYEPPLPASLASFDELARFTARSVLLYSHSIGDGIATRAFESNRARRFEAGNARRGRRRRASVTARLARRDAREGRGCRNTVA